MRPEDPVEIRPRRLDNKSMKTVPRGIPTKLAKVNRFRELRAGENEFRLCRPGRSGEPRRYNPRTQREISGSRQAENGLREGWRRNGNWVQHSLGGKLFDLITLALPRLRCGSHGWFGSRVSRRAHRLKPRRESAPAGRRPTVSPAPRRGRGRSMGRSSATLPSRSTMTRSASATASATSWVIRSVVKPCSRPDALQQAVHLAAGQRVERAERLVEEQDARAADERARERDALTLSARQHGRPVVGAVGEADVLERGLRGLAPTVRCGRCRRCR